MANPSGDVKFEWIPAGQPFPDNPDKSTVYFDEATSTLYVGSQAFGKGVIPANVIANPDIEGTEPELIGLQVAATKYKISQVRALTSPEIADIVDALS